MQVPNLRQNTICSLPFPPTAGGECLSDLLARAPAFRQKAPQRASAPRGKAIRRATSHGNHYLFSYLWRFGGPFHFVSIRFNACYLVPRRMRAPMPLASAFQPAPEKHAHMGFFTPFLQEPLWPGHLTERSNCSCDGPHQ